MDNQALAVLVTVALFGALAIGIVSRTETARMEIVKPGYRYSALADTISPN